VSEQPRNPDATVDALVPPSAEEVRQRFEAACEQAHRSGGQPPDFELFLAVADPEALLALRRELAGIARSYQQRLSQTNLPLKRPAAEDAGETADLPAAVSGAATVTHEAQAPANGTTDFVPSGADEDMKDTRPEGAHADTTPTEATAEARPKVKFPQVGGYDIVGVLGRGAMGVVYKAWQRGLKREVALKMILAGDHATERDLARFRTEAQAVAQLHHPNIVEIHDIGEHDGKPFFSLEYVAGESLSKKVAGAPLPPRVAAEIVRTMALAMRYAHDKGIIHRDLKPANVLVTTDGQPKITDFGLAKRLDEDSGQTHHGSVLGTPSYMPPEQAEGRNADVGPLSDVYSLGAILYELLTGRAPFRAATMLDTLSQVRKQEPVSPVQLQPGTPRDLETICLKCLQKDPKKRYAGAGELAEDLRRYLAGEPIKARPVPLWEHAWRWCRRNPVVAGLSAAVALLLLVALGISITTAAVVHEDNVTISNANTEITKQWTRANENAAAKELEAKKNEKLADHAKKQYNLAVSQIVNIGAQMQKLLRKPSANPLVELELKPVREAMLQTVRNHMVELAKSLERSGITGAAELSLHQMLGDLFRKLGMAEEALDQFVQGYRLAEQLAKDYPDNDTYRANVGPIVARLGDMEQVLKADLPAARANYQKALEVQEDVEAHPRNNYFKPIDHKRLKAFYYVSLGTVALRQGDPAAARKYFDQSVAWRQDWLNDEAAGAKAADLPPDQTAEKTVEPRGLLAESYLLRAEAGARLGDDKAVAEAVEKAVPLIEGIGKDFPQSLDLLSDLAHMNLLIGDAYLRLGKTDKAKGYYDKCIPSLVTVINKDPESLKYLDFVVWTKCRQGVTARLANDPAAANHFAAALKFCDQLAAIDPTSLPVQTQLALCQARAEPMLPIVTYAAAGAQTQLAQRQARAARSADALKKADALRPRVAKDPELSLQLAGCYALCGEADDAQKKALTAKALEILREVAAGGYKDRAGFRTHPDLTPLVNDSTFKQIVD
jgi:serine/threonine-protein kinase